MKMFEDKVLPWLNESFRERCIFTQDGAPAHTSSDIQKWCNNQFAGFWDKNIWPSSGSDINPMDFAIWSILETEVSKVTYSSVTNFKQALTKAWLNLDEETARRCCGSVTAQLGKMI